ncbi:MAG: IS200/IS605 family transposase [Bacteroidetes bacterium]|nr:IS200/IS605 family transposase [Bacteroidota bacterium]
MSSYRQILYHLVFRTKYSYKTLNPIYAKELFAYVSGYVKNKNCVLYRINGVENHLHILCDLHPSIALADFIRDLKTSTSIWLKQSGKFPDFQGWAEGYAALTYGWRDKERIVSYIKNQQEHHKNLSFEDELKKLLLENGVSINENFFP